MSPLDDEKCLVTMKCLHFTGQFTSSTAADDVILTVCRHDKLLSSVRLGIPHVLVTMWCSPLAAFASIFRQLAARRYCNASVTFWQNVTG